MIRAFYMLCGILALSLVSVTALWAQNEPSAGELFRRGNAQINSGEYERALEAGRRVTELAPQRGEGHLLMGRALGFLERYPEAYAAFERAEERGMDASVDRGMTQYQAGETAEAERTLRDAVEKNPRQAEAHYFLGLARLRLGHFAEAREAFAQAAELDAEVAPEALYLSGVAAVRLGQLDVARDDLERSIEAAPYASTAASAEALLADLDADPADALEFRAGLRVEHDSNVLLVPTTRALFTAEEISGRSGSRLVFDLDGKWRPELADHLRGMVGYGLYQSIHVTNRDVLRRFDVTNHALTLGGEWNDGANYLILPYRLSVAFLGPLFRSDYEHFSTTHAISPLYARRFGSHGVGLSNALLFENFAVDPPDVVLDDGESRSLRRDNIANDFSLFYMYYFEENRGQISPEIGWLRTNAKGDNNPWSHSGWHTGTQFSYRVGEYWGLGSFLQYTRRNYDNPYPLPDENAQITLVEREDREWSGGVEWTYDRDDWAVTASWNRIASRSAVELFDYRRSIFSLGFEARF